MHRQNNPIGKPPHEIVEPCSPFDIDVLGAQLEGALQQPPTFFLRPPKSAALPFWPAGDDNRLRSIAQKTREVGQPGEIDPQLDEIGSMRRIPSHPELLGRSAGHRGAELSHKKSLFNPSG
jgi:hypothetical protein